MGVRRIVPVTATNTNLIAGGAFAKGLEVVRKAFFNDHLPFEKALKRGQIEALIYYEEHEPFGTSAVKNVWRTVTALSAYFQAYPIDALLTPVPLRNGKYAIEYSFAVPTQVRSPETNDPILYTGRYDMLGHSPEGTVFIIDEKTSTQLGESWAVQWRMNNQMTGYIWGSQQSGLAVDWACIRGLSFLTAGYGSCEVLTHRPKWRIEKFEENLNLTLRTLVNAWQTNTWEQNLGRTCADFGGCAYLTLCESKEPEEWIPLNFKENTWNPLH